MGSEKAIGILRGQGAHMRLSYQGRSQDGKVIGNLSSGRCLGSERSLGRQPRPHLLTLDPADHESLTFAALGRAPQPPQLVCLGCIGQCPLPEGAAWPILQPISQVCRETGSGVPGLPPTPRRPLPASPGSRSSKSSEDSVPMDETFTSRLAPGPGVRRSQKLGTTGSWGGSKAKGTFLAFRPSRTTHRCP